MREFPWDALRLYWTPSLGWKPSKICCQLEPKALNRIFLSFDNIDNKVKNLVKIDLSDKIR